MKTSPNDQRAPDMDRGDGTVRTGRGRVAYLRAWQDVQLKCTSEIWGLLSSLP
jgi:predicted phosphatase